MPNNAFGGAVPVTIFLCGPSKCEHDYSGWRDFEGGGTAVCTKCGAEAFSEAVWDYNINVGK